MIVPNELNSKSNIISWTNDRFQDINIDSLYNKLPEKFEAIILSGQPEQHNSPEELKAFGTEFKEQNDNRYFFVRIMPLKTQGVILPDPFEAANLHVAKRLINAYPLAYIAVNEAGHPPTHGDVYECRLTTKDRRSIALIRRLRNSGKKIGRISNREIHKGFRGTGSSSLLGPSGGSGASSGFVPPPPGTTPRLQNQTPVVRAAENGQPEIAPPDNGMACSVLVAIWALNQMNKRPVEAEWPNWQSWYKLDKSFWAKAQITKRAGGGPGSIINIIAYQEKLGGSYVKYSRQQTQSSAPKLTRGKWHIVQRWTPKKESPEEYETGHTYLVYWGGGDTVRFVDSSHKYHYKDRTKKIGSWWRKGSEETVLTLPFGG